MKFLYFFLRLTAFYRSFVSLFLLSANWISWIHFFCPFSPRNLLCFICYEFCTILCIRIKFALKEQPKARGSCRVLKFMWIQIELDLTFAPFLHRIHLTKSKPQQRLSGGKFDYNSFHTLIKSLVRWPFNFISFCLQTSAFLWPEKWKWHDNKLVSFSFPVEIY